MTVRPILRWPDPALSAVCAPVGRPDGATLKLADDLIETMYAAPGRGLAAPQVGVLSRVFVMDTGWSGTEDRAPRIFFDPVITGVSAETVTGPEGCLSIPGISVEVTRAAEIALAWTDREGARREGTLSGIEAICAQHEIDHLDGRVTLDRLAAEAREAAEAAYGACA